MGQIAKSKHDATLKYKFRKKRAQVWHRATLETQAGEALHRIGQPRPGAGKVKVLPGASASCVRVPVNAESRLSLSETAERRDYANYVIQQRLDKVTTQYKNDLVNNIIPYTTHV